MRLSFLQDINYLHTSRLDKSQKLTCNFTESALFSSLQQVKVAYCYIIKYELGWRNMILKGPIAILFPSFHVLIVLSEFSSVQSLSHVQLFATPWITARRPPCPSTTPGVHSDSHPSSQWCHPAIISSVVPFSSCLQSLYVISNLLYFLFLVEEYKQIL